MNTNPNNRENPNQPVQQKPIFDSTNNNIFGGGNIPTLGVSRSNDFFGLSESQSKPDLSQNQVGQIQQMSNNQQPGSSIEQQNGTSENQPNNIQQQQQRVASQPKMPQQPAANNHFEDSLTGSINNLSSENKQGFRGIFSGFENLIPKGLRGHKKTSQIIAEASSSKVPDYLFNLEEMLGEARVATTKS